MNIRSLVAIAVVAISLGGCASIQKDWGILTGATVSTQAVVVSGNSVDALEATATNYLNLPSCAVAGHPPICRQPSATLPIINAVRSMRVARNNLESFLVANPGQLGPTGLYNALTAAITTVTQIFAQYNVQVQT